MSSRTLGGRSAGSGGGVSLMCFIATVSAPSPMNGRLTRNRFVANNSQRVDIAGGGGVVAERLLRRDVLGGAHHHAGLRDRRRVDGLGDAEVGELHLPGGRDQDVAGFDVAVDQPGGVGDLKRPAGLLEHVERVPQRQAGRSV